MELSTGVPRPDMGWLVCADTVSTTALVSRITVAGTGQRADQNTKARTLLSGQDPRIRKAKAYSNLVI
ncbi:hypothetical protein OIU85_028415 [Salix viminalis]|uniref:Uncharacterized protein n=1 Tax=Salix viminalis TaxID=40686 RepID=A0A9Q0QKC1_SALVM|nr:hypothetical protein OIU85_028415 [Salix viminalis]